MPDPSHPAVLVAKRGDVPRERIQQRHVQERPLQEHLLARLAHPFLKPHLRLFVRLAILTNELHALSRKE